MATPWQPGEALKAMNEFIASTSATSAKQLYFLELAKPFISAELYSKTDKKVESDIEQNVKLLSEICIGLQKQGIKIQVKHPDSGQIAELAGIAYSTESISYQAGVNEAGKLATWPLVDGTQIRIIK